MTNQSEAFNRFHSFSTFRPIFSSFCLLACLSNAGPPLVLFQDEHSLLEGIFDHVPNDIRSLKIKLKVVSLNFKLSITIIYNDCDDANNSRKGICNTSCRIATNAFATSILPVLTNRRQLFVTLLRSEILTCRH